MVRLRAAGIVKREGSKPKGGDAQRLGSLEPDPKGARQTM